MGFGTLFIGYFLILNVTYFGYTDLISGLIMLMGLYKLSTVNKDFKAAFYTASVFSVFGAAELVISFISMFAPAFKESSVLIYVTPPRYAIIAILTAFILRGIYSVAKEVGLKLLANKAKYYLYVSTVIFSIATVFDLPLFGFMNALALAIISLIILLAVFGVVIINLTIIYKAYMKICMPDESVYKEEKKSKFEFVNRFKAHEAEKQREYAQYKLAKMSNAATKKKKKKKGKKK